jgi:hypothetical protein
MIIVKLSKNKDQRHDIKGVCANCNQDVFESQFILDDCYNVWAGECPHCNAINLLSMNSLRGYSSSGMDLVLPTDEEIDANESLQGKGIPTQGSKGPANFHGTVSGEVAHILLNPLK